MITLSYLNIQIMEEAQFAHLSLKEKVHIIFDYGNEITSRRFLHFNIKLYSVMDFFAEVWYAPADNRIERVEALTVDEILILYKKEFDISGLLK